MSRYMNKNSLVIFFVFSLIANIGNVSMDACRAEEISPDISKEALQEKVDNILRQEVSVARRSIKDVFRLADIYAREGKDQKAMDLYKWGLGIDSWDLWGQLKYAELLRKNGDSVQASQKFNQVLAYAEDEKLADQAETLLGASPSQDGGKDPAVSNQSMEIVLVPIGDINKRLLAELRGELERKTGIRYSISGQSVDPGNVDRFYVDQILGEMIRQMKLQLPKSGVEGDRKGSGPRTRAGKIKFIQRFMIKHGAHPEDLFKFNGAIELLQAKGQYDASKLLSLLEARFKIPQNSPVMGYLGVTSEDIFNRRNNFLFSLSGDNHAVVSYFRMTSAFNKTPANRPRLLERTLKQAICSSCFLLGIPRCTSVGCVMAYTSGTVELDEKTTELCDTCKLQLRALLNYSKSEANA